MSPVDYTFEQAASSQRGDWPLVDSGYPIQAYADVSFQILNTLGETGSHLYDVRYFYTSSPFLTKQGLSTIILNNLGTPTKPATNPFNQQSWDHATPAQFTAALQQIGLELQQATSAYGYLGTGSVRGILAGSDTTIYADMIGMASVISGDDAQASNATAAAKLSKELKLAGGIVSLGKFIPAVGPIFGAVGGALKVGATAVAPSNGSLPENFFDVTLSELTKGATTYTANLTSGYDGAVDNILSDSGKLNTVGTLTSNSDSTWNLPAQITPDQLQTPLVDAAARSLWLDIIPQLYGIRTFFNGPSNKPGDYGIYEGYGVCGSLYSKADPAAYGAYFSVGSNAEKYDLYVFAEGLKASLKAPYDTVVSKTLADLLTTSGTYSIGGNTQNGMNFPPMLLYGYSNMTYSPFLTADGWNAAYCFSK